MSRALTVLVVDDEALARSRLRTLLADCSAPPALWLAEAATAAQALAWLQHHTADVALIDIHMPGADGLSLARALTALAAPPAVVFVTAHAEHAVQAFELDALDYLTKPVRLERLPLAQVLYLKAELKYLTVGTATATHLLEGALSELEQRHAHRFIRIHRNALVARAALRALEKTEAGPDGSGWAVRLHGIDEPLPVSRRQLNAVREAILA